MNSKTFRFYKIRNRPISILVSMHTKVDPSIKYEHYEKNTSIYKKNDPNVAIIFTIIVPMFFNDFHIICWFFQRGPRKRDPRKGSLKGLPERWSTKWGEQELVHMATKAAISCSTVACNAASACSGTACHAIACRATMGQIST